MTVNESFIVRILCYQFVVACFISILFLVAIDDISGQFSFVGGMIAFLPNAYFGFRLMKTAKEAKAFLNVFYINECLKLILTALLFFAAFKIPNVQLLPLLTCYVGVLSIFWFALLMRY